MKHRARIDNKIADALSKVVVTLNTVGANVIGFDSAKEEYLSCPDFGEVYLSIVEGKPISPDFVIQEGFLFQGTHLCIPHGSLRDLVVWKLQPFV